MIEEKDVYIHTYDSIPPTNQERDGFVLLKIDNNEYRKRWLYERVDVKYELDQTMLLLRSPALAYGYAYGDVVSYDLTTLVASGIRSRSEYQTIRVHTTATGTDRFRTLVDDLITEGCITEMLDLPIFVFAVLESNMESAIRILDNREIVDEYEYSRRD